jgi:hypothetical protein
MALWAIGAEFGVFKRGRAVRPALAIELSAWRGSAAGNGALGNWRSRRLQLSLPSSLRELAAY